MKCKMLTRDRFRIRSAGVGAGALKLTAGFTLLELLVIIAIISLLIAILLPAYSAARQQSRRLACQSNLRQIAVAWHLYLNRDEHFFQMVNANVNYGGRQGNGAPAYGIDMNDPQHSVPKPLNPLLGLPTVTHDEADVFRCPSDRGGGVIRTTCYEHFGTSYPTNLMLVGQNKLLILPSDPCKSVLMQINTRLPSLTRSSISNESRLILLGDYGWWHTLAFNSKQRIAWHGRPCSHNVAFMDGHVDFLRVRKGLFVTPEYVVIPFDGLLSAAAARQVERPCE